MASFDRDVGINWSETQILLIYEYYYSTLAPYLRSFHDPTSSKEPSFTDLNIPDALLTELGFEGLKDQATNTNGENIRNNIVKKIQQRLAQIYRQVASRNRDPNQEAHAAEGLPRKEHTFAAQLRTQDSALVPMMSPDSKPYGRALPPHMYTTASSSRDTTATDDKSRTTAPANIKQEKRFNREGSNEQTSDDHPDHMEFNHQAFRPKPEVEVETGTSQWPILRGFPSFFLNGQAGSAPKNNNSKDVGLQDPRSTANILEGKGKETSIDDGDQSEADIRAPTAWNRDTTAAEGKSKARQAASFHSHQEKLNLHDVAGWSRDNEHAAENTQTVFKGAGDAGAMKEDPSEHREDRVRQYLEHLKEEEECEREIADLERQFEQLLLMAPQPRS
ncbi:hypothetical protein WAI453_013716 [Rhynchosporium graminicola]